MLGWWEIYRASSWCCEPICSWGRNHLMRSERVSFFCVFSMLFFRWNRTFFLCQWKREMCLSATLVSCAKFADLRGKSQQQQIIIIIRLYKYACGMFLQDKTVAVFFLINPRKTVCFFSAIFWLENRARTGQHNGCSWCWAWQRRRLGAKFVLLSLSTGVYGRYIGWTGQSGYIIHQNPSIITRRTPPCRPDMIVPNEQAISWVPVHTTITAIRGQVVDVVPLWSPTFGRLASWLWIVAEVIWGAQVIIPDSQPAQTAAWRTLYIQDWPNWAKNSMAVKTRNECELMSGYGMKSERTRRQRVSIFHRIPLKTEWLSYSIFI